MCYASCAWIWENLWSCKLGAFILQVRTTRFLFKMGEIDKGMLGIINVIVNDSPTNKFKYLNHWEVQDTTTLMHSIICIDSIIKNCVWSDNFNMVVINNVTRY